MKKLTIHQQNRMYQIWEDLPPIKYLDKSQFQIMDNPIRDAIVNVLRRGIMDAETSKYRRVLSMTELLFEVNKRLKKKNDSHEVLKKPALYYHVDLLLEHGLLQDAITVKIGKHHQSFYTRTAKGFILRKVSQYNKTSKFHKLHTKLITGINKDLDGTQVVNILSEIENKRLKITEQRDLWIKENLPMITDLDVDIIDLVEAFDWYYHIHPDMIELFKKLGYLLKLPGFQESASVKTS